MGASSSEGSCISEEEVKELFAAQRIGGLVDDLRCVLAFSVLESSGAADV
jgi:hypothetical protein